MSVTGGRLMFCLIHQLVIASPTPLVHCFTVIYIDNFMILSLHKFHFMVNHSFMQQLFK